MQLFAFNASATAELSSFFEERRRSSVALLLASGPSADTNAHQSAILQQLADVWSLNQAFLHPFLIPRFYYVEFKLKSARDSSEQIWKRFFDARLRRRFNETTFVSPKAQFPVLLKTLRMGALPAAAVSVEIRTDEETAEHGCSLDALRNRPLRLRVYCASSLTALVVIATRLNYTNIAFLGVDLNSPYHFYSGFPDMPYYEQLVTASSVETFGSSTHATAARGVHYFLDHAATSARQRFFNLSPRSLLRTNASHIAHTTPTRLPNALLRVR
jgi:hypothetical protein